MEFDWLKQKIKQESGSKRLTSDLQTTEMKNVKIRMMAAELYLKSHGAIIYRLDKLHDTLATILKRKSYDKYKTERRV